MKRLLVAVGLLALGIVVFLWLLPPKEGTGRSGVGPDQAMPEQGQTAAVPEATELVTAAPVSAGPDGVPGDERRVVADEAKEKEEPPPRTWPEAETRWVTASIVLPDGTPRDEVLRVIALEDDAGTEDVYGEDGPAEQLFAGKDPSRVRHLLAAATVDGTGFARIGLPPDAEEAWLGVSGSYLYSMELQHVDLTPEGTLELGTLELRPVLGARISGRLLAPAGKDDADLSGVDVELDWSINSALGLGGAASSRLDREMVTDASGGFDFRALPVGKPQALNTRAPELARTFGEDLQPEPGEHLRVDVQLAFGGTIRGRIVDSTGQPVAEAEITALGREFFGNPTDDLREVESDGEGRFELAGLTPGKVWLRVAHDDFQRFLSKPFPLEDGEVREHGDIPLNEGLVISGTVVFPDGAPATGTNVKVEPDLGQNLAGSPVDPRAYIGANENDAADEEGKFRIKGLGPGPWTVAAELSIEEATDGGPVAGRWSANQALVSAPGADIALVLEAPIHVDGQVLDTAAEPVAAFRIRAERAGTQWYMPPSEERSESFETEKGDFVMSDLRSGKWTFTAEAEGYAGSEEIELELPGEEALAFTLSRPVRLQGRVVDPDGRPVAGAEVGKELEGTEVFEAMQGRADWPTVTSASDGAFVLEELQPGTGSVVAKKDGFARSAAVAYELEEGQQEAGLELALRRGGTITGLVYGSDGDPSGGCMVILQMPTMEERRFTNTDSDGAFAEQGLTPGNWQVQAFPGVESLQSESGEPLDQATLIAALKMTTLELADEGEEHVVLGKPPENPVRVHGQVTLGGEPVTNTIISFVPTAGGGMEFLKIQTLGAEGRYDLRLDTPGDYLVTIQTADTPGRQNSVEYRRAIPEGEDFQLDFGMPLGRVSGLVRGPDGDPVADARVTLNMDGGQVFGTVFGGQYNETATDANGEYEIAYLRPGRYTVAAGGSFLGGLFTTENRLGRQVTAVEVEADQWVRGVDFRLEEPGEIHGVARDASGALVEGASIFVRDGAGHLVELFSVSQTNASGRFEYPGLAPGEYTITARSDVLSSTHETPVRVRAGESGEVTVTMEPGTMLLVTLTDKSGKDVPSRVSVQDAQGRELNGMLGLTEIMERYTGGLGSAVQRVGPLPPGTYQVQAFAEDGRSTKRPVTLSGQAERKVKLRLR